eukprot:766688-Hanusia_phi.AAC.1
MESPSSKDLHLVLFNNHTTAYTNLEPRSTPSDPGIPHFHHTQDCITEFLQKSLFRVMKMNTLAGAPDRRVGWKAAAEAATAAKHADRVNMAGGLVCGWRR